MAPIERYIAADHGCRRKTNENNSQVDLQDCRKYSLFVTLSG